MRYLVLLMCGWFVLLTPARTLALEVVDGMISTAIVDHQPVDSIQSYPATAGKLYCFTRIVGGDGASQIFHVWYRGQQEVSRIALPIRASDWNTWSVKVMDPEWTGPWRVEVVDGQGKRLKVISFTLL